jgi:hypothetical protein
VAWANTDAIHPSPWSRVVFFLLSFPVLRLISVGTFETVYNGDLQRAWNKYGYLKGNVTLKRFRELQKAVERKDIIPEKTTVCSK